MTTFAYCPQCTYVWVANSPHPVTPAHQHPATGLWCAGASTLALVGVS